MAGAADMAALGALFAAIGGIVPGLPMAVAAPVPGAVVPGSDNRAPLARLVAGVRRAHPAAGRAFWAVRSWSLLEWQPAAVAVLGVHAAGIVPAIERIALLPGAGGIFGFALPAAAVARGSEAGLIGRAGPRLRAAADALIGDLDAVIPLKRRLAERLLADRVLGLLALLAARAPETPPEATLEATLGRAEAWLDALGLPGASRLAPLTLASGRRQAVLVRRSCCLEYRVAGGVCCMSCPRLAPAERDARIRRHFDAAGETHAAAR